MGELIIGVEESVIEVDKKNRKVGLRLMHEFQTGKFIHRSAHLLLFNSKGEVLIQKRSPNKTWYPNLYTYSVSGVVADESYAECLNKEMKEELGILIPAKQLFIYPYFDKMDKSFHALFSGISDAKLTPDKNEISQLIWLTPEKLKEDIKTNPKKYVPHVLFGFKKYFKEF